MTWLDYLYCAVIETETMNSRPLSKNEPVQGQYYPNRHYIKLKKEKKKIFPVPGAMQVI